MIRTRHRGGAETGSVQNFSRARAGATMVTLLPFQDGEAAGRWALRLDAFIKRWEHMAGKRGGSGEASPVQKCKCHSGVPTLCAWQPTRTATKNQRGGLEPSYRAQNTLKVGGRLFFPGSAPTSEFGVSHLLHPSTRRLSAPGRSVHCLAVADCLWATTFDALIWARKIIRQALATETRACSTACGGGQQLRFTARLAARPGAATLATRLSLPPWPSQPSKTQNRLSCPQW